MQNNQQEIALCGAPAGGCGFRGRDWRKGQLVSGYFSDGSPHCACGSQMKPFQPRRFLASDPAPITKRCEACNKPVGDNDDDCGSCVNCRLPLCVHDDRYDVEGDGNVCPRACNAIGPHQEICDDTIAHEGSHRWEAP